MLPSNFTQLEYIQSSGTQHVDTGFTPNQDTRFVIDFETLTTSGEQHIASARTSGGTPLFTLYYSNTGNYSTRYGTNEIQILLSGVGLGRHVLDKNKNVTTADGTTTVTATYETFTVGSTLTIFCRNDGTSTNGYITGRVYSCQVYDNDTLARNFIPCKNDSGVVGLWDDVNSEFYGNAGTGTFVAGPVVPQEMAESDIVELEYIESTGTQFVNSGVQLADTLSAEVDYQAVTATNDTWFFSALYLTSTENIGWRVGLWQQAFYLIDMTASQTGDLTARTLFSGRATQSYALDIYLFAENRNGSVYGPSAGRMYGCRIWNNGVLVRNFIPAKTVAGEIGLYDKVFKEFYRNAGSGVFTAGPEILVEPPVVPENFRMVRASITAISLAWDAVENATSYQLDQNGARVLDANVTSYTASGLAQETEYTFSLTAVNRSGASEAVTLTAKTTALVLITDRKNSDVERVKELARKIESGLATEEELAEWNSGTLKGSYNASDLNRVGAAMNYVAAKLEEFGYAVSVSPKTDWSDEEWPAPDSMKKYLDDLAELRSQFALMESTPAVPGDMEQLTYTEANNIEKILKDIDLLLTKSAKSWFFCGDLYSGEV